MPITPRLTRRVETDGGSPAIPPTLESDSWGGSWGGSWGYSWLTTLIIPAIGPKPAVGVTPRVSLPVAARHTRRVSKLTVNLLLEGDESGDLLLEGDMQSNGDALAFEGDAVVLGDNLITRRVVA